MSDFYVGYLPDAPAELRRSLRRITLFLLTLVAGVAVILVSGQSQFPAAAFDFTDAHEFEGALQESPIPALLVQRPGKTSDIDGYSRYILISEGKHGAGTEVRGRSGQIVRLRAKLIYRDDQTLLEVVPGSIRQIGAAALPKPIDVGVVTLTGEIVDSKCYTGVMNPGQGKVHRECAARCISGGVPPALLVRESNGAQRVYFLAAADGSAIGPRLLSKAAESVTLSGHLWMQGDSATLVLSPADISHRAPWAPRS